jgi:hypothetical protein
MCFDYFYARKFNALSISHNASYLTAVDTDQVRLVRRQFVFSHFRFLLPWASSLSPPASSRQTTSP